MKPPIGSGVGKGHTAHSKVHKLVPIELPREIRGSIEPDSRGYRMGSCTIILSHSSAGWHMSIANHHRLPTWDEIAAARYALIPNDVDMAMLLPPVERYINLHDNCFQLWEVKDNRIEGQPMELGQRSG